MLVRTPTRVLLSFSISKVLTALLVLTLCAGCGKGDREAVDADATPSEPATNEVSDTGFLIREGVGNSEIVTIENPPRMVRFAATELQTYLEKITGAKVPIVNQTSGGGTIPIYVGISPATENLELSTEGLQYGAFRMAAGKDWLALLGPDKDFEPIEPWGRKRGESARVNAEFEKIAGMPFASNMSNLYQRFLEDIDVWDVDDRGTLNAVYTYLESLGVRWFAPGELGEVVPELVSIQLPAPKNEEVTPDFALRRISFYHTFFGKPELTLWALRMRTNIGHDLIGLTQHCHGLRFVHETDGMKKLHPEFYAVWDGVSAADHRGGQGAVSLGHEELFDVHLKYVRTIFDHYNEPMVSIEPVDGTGALICDRDKHLAEPERGGRGVLSNYVWGYVDRVAREIHKSHPDRMVSGLAYSAYFDPPTAIETMSPNLALFQARWRANFGDEEYREQMRNNREEWLKKLPSGMLFLHEYYLHAVPGNQGRPVYFTKLIADDLRELKGKSMGEIIEVYDHRPNRPFPWDEFAVNHLNLYVTMQLLWDVDQSLESLLDDYYTKYYGPAAEPMRAFIEYSEANWSVMSQQVEPVRTALDLLNTAHAAAPDGTPFAERIQRVLDFCQEPMDSLIATLGKKRNLDSPYRVLISNNLLEKGLRLSDNRIDGVLEPEFWPDVRRESFRPSMPDGAVSASTTFQAIREDNFIYIAFRCQEPDMENLAITTTDNDDPKIFDGDFVSLIIETGTHSYYEIAVNPAGAVFEADRAEDSPVEWRSEAIVGVHKGADFWSVEIRLPIMGAGARVLDPKSGIDGARPSDLYPWFFNAGRQRVSGEKVEFTSIFPTGQPDLHNIEAAGKMWGK